MAPPVPETLDEVLSPAWLTSALDMRFPGIEVTTVTPGPVISRVSTNARFTIECAGALPADLSPHLCAKGFFGEPGSAYQRAGTPEALFYRDLVESTGVRTLRSVYADVAPDTGHGVIITEDVVAQGATFLDPRSDYTPDLAAASFTELARLHGTTWMAPEFATTPWLQPHFQAYLATRGLPEVSGNFESWIGAGIPRQVRDAERLVATYRSLADELNEATPWSVIHGDTHIGNVYVDGSGQPAFLDWQLVQRGPWYVDVGYHLASALTVEDRRANERDLVRHYLGELAAAGGDAPSEEEAWRGIPRGILHGFYLWGITLKVEPAVTAMLLERMGTAASDHDALG